MKDNEKLSDHDIHDCVNIMNSIISQCCEIQKSMIDLQEFFNVNPFIGSNATEHSPANETTDTDRTGEQN